MSSLSIMIITIITIRNNVCFCRTFWNPFDGIKNEIKNESLKSKSNRCASLFCILVRHVTQSVICGFVWLFPSILECTMCNDFHCSGINDDDAFVYYKMNRLKNIKNEQRGKLCNCQEVLSLLNKKKIDFFL